MDQTIVGDPTSLPSGPDLHSGTVQAESNFVRVQNDLNSVSSLQPRPPAQVFARTPSGIQPVSGTALSPTAATLRSNLMQNEVLRASLQTESAGPHGIHQTLENIEKISVSELAQIDRKSTLVAKIPARGDYRERASIETMKARGSTPTPAQTPTLDEQGE